MTPGTVDVLADRIKALSPSDQLRLAASLIEAGQYDTALVLVDRIGGELTVLRLVKK